MCFNREMSLSVPVGQTAIIAGVCAAVSIILVITALVVGFICCRKNQAKNYIPKRSHTNCGHFRL